MKFIYPEVKTKNGEFLFYGPNGKKYNVKEYRTQDYIGEVVYDELTTKSFILTLDGHVHGPYDSTKREGGAFVAVQGGDLKQETFIDVLGRKTAEKTNSGDAAFFFVKLIYGGDSKETLLQELDKLPNIYFAEEDFHKGILMVIGKYVKDDINHAYTQGRNLPTVKETQAFLKQCVAKCTAKQKAGVIEKKRQEKRAKQYDALMETIDTSLGL